MNILFRLLLLITIISVITSCDKQPVEYVNTSIGTAIGGAGGTFIGTATPFAMTWFGPMTNPSSIGKMPYYFDEPSICGFIATHQPTVWMGDYGEVSFMPQINNLNIGINQRKCFFSHKDETAHPYYYSVSFIGDVYEQKEIKTEVASTSRCGYFRFTFPTNNGARLIIDATRNSSDIGWVESHKPFMGFIEVDTIKNEIRGYNNDRYSCNIGPDLPNFKGYFILKFNQKITGTKYFQKDSVIKGKSNVKGKQCGAFVEFNIPNGGIVEMRVVTSFISLEQAEINLSKEIPNWNFDAVVNNSKKEWNEMLSRMDVKGATEDEKTVLYTALYHCLLLPRTFSEYGKYYSAFDDKIHDGESYNDFSLWDTYRAEHPLLILLAPEKVAPMITSLLQMYKEGGWLPKWPNPTYTNEMNGTHADAVIADAYIKGIRGFDTTLAYEAIRKNSFVAPYGDSGNINWVKHPWSKDTLPPKDLPKEAGNPWWDREEWHGYEARAGLSWYLKLGYVPCDMTSESVSNTLECAYDDFCVAQMAKGMGKQKDYEILIKHSKYYKNIYNPATGMMAPRKANGEWDKDVNTGFTEGSPWTYLFCAMQDINGLIELMGGQEKFAKKLDRNFEEKHYVHENEPGHHYIYLYDYCGQEWKTQELIRTHTHLNYSNRPDGINGNDDCGQMSAWYIFGCLGFYPVCPGSDEYAVGAPQFEKLSIKLANNHKLNVIAKNISEENKYIQSLTIDGVEIHKPFIKHSQIANGAEVVFVMGNKPNKEWFKQ